TLTGSGSDIWNASDQFHFDSRTLAGDGVVIAKVNSPGNTSPWAKAGVMIRNDLTAGAAFADVVVTSANSVSFQYRTAAGAAAQAVYANGVVSAPIWLKLTRTGNIFTAAYSYDGTFWNELG